MEVFQTKKGQISQIISRYCKAESRNYGMWSNQTLKWSKRMFVPLPLLWPTGRPLAGPDTGGWSHQPVAASRGCAVIPLGTTNIRIQTSSRDMHTCRLYWWHVYLNIKAFCLSLLFKIIKHIYSYLQPFVLLHKSTRNTINTMHLAHHTESISINKQVNWNISTMLMKTK